MLTTLAMTSLIALTGLKTEVQVRLCDAKSEISRNIELKKWTLDRQYRSYLIDNRNLTSLKAGWSARVRVDQKKGLAEITLKKNSPIHLDPMKFTSSFPPEDATTLKCEYDLHGSMKKLACKMKQEISISDFEKIQKSEKLMELFSEKQKDWLKEEGFDVPQNVELAGPFESETYSYVKKHSEYVLEFTVFRNMFEFTEISSRVEEEDEFEALDDLEKFIDEKDVSACADQTISNLRKKLEAFFQ